MKIPSARFGFLIRWLTVSALVLTSGCPHNTSGNLASTLQKGKPNPFLNLWVGFSDDALRVYNHAIIRSFRGKSDCQPDCPKVDVWLYRYKPALSEYPNGHNKPIATQKKYWKVDFEARIISTVLFGSNPKYLNGLQHFLNSNDSLKKSNGISDPKWGYDTFTFRVYVPKRNPANTTRTKQMAGAIPDSFIERLLDMGCEVAYVDNQLDNVGLDATFWRFMITAEEMPDNQRVRYLVRDVDWLVTAAEAYAVGEWINSGAQFHRAQILPTCIGPIQAGLWGGFHQGKGHFFDLKDYTEKYPYRLFYGDDETFGRDIIWPRMAYAGSIMTHYYADEFFTFMGTPYQNSCARPTQTYCDEIKPGGKCSDLMLPNNVAYPYVALGTHEDNEPFLSRAEFFDMHVNETRAQNAARGLSINPDFK